MKRILSLLLALAMALSLCACSQETGELLLDIAIDVLEEGNSSEAPGSANTSQVQQETEPPDASQQPETQSPEVSLPAKDGSYTTKEDVALYLYTYGCLPDNFITKKEAQSLGWPGGDLEPYAPGKCIGGDRFGNYEGLLPAKEGRTYQECDIDTLGADERGAKRIVFSNDGLIYYTDDHYESFELLYGEASR